MNGQGNNRRSGQKPVQRKSGGPSIALTVSVVERQQASDGRYCLWCYVIVKHADGKPVDAGHEVIFHLGNLEEVVEVVGDGEPGRADHMFELPASAAGKALQITAHAFIGEKRYEAKTSVQIPRITVDMDVHMAEDGDLFRLDVSAKTEEGGVALPGEPVQLCLFLGTESSSLGSKKTDDTGRARFEFVLPRKHFDGERITVRTTPILLLTASEEKSLSLPKRETATPSNRGYTVTVETAGFKETATELKAKVLVAIHDKDKKSVPGVTVEVVLGDDAQTVTTGTDGRAITVFSLPFSMGGKETEAIATIDGTNISAKAKIAVPTAKNLASRAKGSWENIGDEIIKKSLTFAMPTMITLIGLMFDGSEGVIGILLGAIIAWRVSKISWILATITVAGITGTALVFPEYFRDPIIFAAFAAIIIGLPFLVAEELLSKRNATNEKTGGTFNLFPWVPLGIGLAGILLNIFAAGADVFGGGGGNATGGLAGMDTYDPSGGSDRGFFGGIVAAVGNLRDAFSWLLCVAILLWSVPGEFRKKLKEDVQDGGASTGWIKPLLAAGFFDWLLKKKGGGK